MIAKEIIEPTFGVKIFLISKCTPKQARKKVRDKFNYDVAYDASTEGSVLEHKQGRYFILWLRRRDDDTIQHEVGHIFDYVCAWREIYFDPRCQACSEVKSTILPSWYKLVKDALK